MGGEGRGPGPCPREGTARWAPPKNRYLCPGASSSTAAFPLLGRGESGTGTEAGTALGSPWGVTALSHAPSAVPSPLSPPRCALTSDPAPSPGSPGLWGPSPLDSARQGTVQALLQAGPGPGVPREGTVALTWPRWPAGSGRGGPDTGLAWPGWRSSAVGSGGRAGAALRKFGRGVNYGKGKKIKKTS